MINPTQNVKSIILLGFVVSDSKLSKRIRRTNDNKIVIERELYGWWDIVVSFEIDEVVKAIQYFNGN